jgi:hypothetical protein
MLSSPLVLLISAAADGVKRSSPAAARRPCARVTTGGKPFGRPGPPTAYSGAARTMSS